LAASVPGVKDHGAWKEKSTNPTATQSIRLFYPTPLNQHQNRMEMTPADAIAQSQQTSA
jgi:hypothetical protein